MARELLATLFTTLALAAVTANAQAIDQTDVPFDMAAPDVPAVTLGTRVLHCSVRHATNLDISKQQTDADIIYGDAHDFTITLAGGQIPYAVGTGTARSDIMPKAGYAISSDPQGLFSMGPAGLDRVADYWPKHVEIGKTIMGKAFAFVLLDAVQGDPTRMNAFVSRAVDAVTIDVTWVHRGTCTIE